MALVLDEWVETQRNVEELQAELARVKQERDKLLDILKGERAYALRAMDCEFNRCRYDVSSAYWATAEGISIALEVRGFEPRRTPAERNAFHRGIVARYREGHFDGL